MRRSRPHPHLWTGAYAMHSLSGAEAARFGRHLARCAACAQEVGGFAETAARLAGAAVEPPPAALRRRVMAAAARTRQLPPVTHETLSWTARRAADCPAITIGSLRPPRPGRLALAAVAAVVALAAILGLAARAALRQLAADQAGSHRVAAVLTAPDATMLDARVTTGGSVTVVMSRRQRALVFAAAGLRPLPSSRCYELWLLAPRADTPAARLPAPRQDRTGPVTVSGLAPADRLGLTVEPAGGSPHPTTAMILTLAP